MPKKLARSEQDFSSGPEQQPKSKPNLTTSLTGLVSSACLTHPVSAVKDSSSYSTHSRCRLLTGFYSPLFFLGSSRDDEVELKMFLQQEREHTQWAVTERGCRDRPDVHLFKLTDTHSGRNLTNIRCALEHMRQHQTSPIGTRSFQLYLRHLHVLSTLPSVVCCHLNYTSQTLSYSFFLR